MGASRTMKNIDITNPLEWNRRGNHLGGDVWEGGG